jgi:hypothetical protein
VCVLSVGIGVPGCSQWADVFVRDLPTFTTPDLTQLSRMETYDAARLTPPREGANKVYAAMRDALPDVHPCRRVTLAECYRGFVAALMA